MDREMDTVRERNGEMEKEKVNIARTRREDSRE